MKYFALLFLIPVFCLSSACSGTPSKRKPSSDEKPENHFSHLPKGGRRALHGMVLFGAGPYFLEHIPMLSPPHDFQIIAQVNLTGKNGKPLKGDFSSATFTLKPAADFSLNDYVAGRLRKFSGSIFAGGFEQGGKVIKGLESVKVEVTEYKIIRSLPAESDEELFQLKDKMNTYKSNVIRADENIQQIYNVTNDTQLWCVKGPDFFDPCN